MEENSKNLHNYSLKTLQKINKSFTICLQIGRKILI